MNKHNHDYRYDIRENRISILPALIAGMGWLTVTVIATVVLFPSQNGLHKYALAAFEIGGCAYLISYYRIYTRYPQKTPLVWINAALAGVSLGVFRYFIPDELGFLVYALVFMAALGSSVISSRAPAYLLVTLIFVIHAWLFLHTRIQLSGWITHAGLFIAALIAVETVQQLKTISQEHMKQLETINEISGRIMSALDTDQLFSLLDAALKKALDADTYFIGILDNDELKMPLFYDDGEYFNGAKYRLENSFSKWVIDNQSPLFLPDLRKPLKIEGITANPIGQPKPSYSWMGVPIKGSHITGILAIAAYRPNAFTRSDFEMLISIAHRAGLALERSLLFAESRQQAAEIKLAYDKLESTYDQTLTSLVSALDARDHETEGHSSRVSQLAVKLGEALGFPMDQLKILERGSILHDIGKIGISDNILHKPGPLTENEWKIMKLHPDIGARIVESIPFLQDTLPLIRHHQERWNGSGYPGGLKGNDIPPLARLFAVVDTFDALTSNRPYRKKISTQEALDYLRTESETLFDPHIVSAFRVMIHKDPTLALRWNRKATPPI